MKIVSSLRWLRVASASSLLVAACAPPHHLERVGEARAPTAESGPDHRPSAREVDAVTLAKAQTIRVLPNTDVGCVTEALGLVDVHEGASTSEQALEELRIEAAKLGADAVVGVEFEHADGKAATHLSGMAVRCRDLLRGRPYDVIGVVEVPGDMGNEEQAFRALKERARVVHADLLLGVTFVHGEGTGPTRLRATAIRFREASR
jgi:uncharacterized protein YbjQ (UPF0145 family)